MDEPFDETNQDERQRAMAILKKKRYEFLKRERELADNMYSLYVIRRLRY